MTNLTICDYLLNSLAQRGAQHIFGVPGDYVLRIDKRIEEHADLEFINTTAELTAGYMADAYARLRGLGVACITYGVGISIVTAMAQAFVESSPLVIISGAAGSLEFSKGIKLHHLLNQTINVTSETNQLDIFKNLTVAQAVLNDPKTAKQQIDQLLDQCQKLKKPVYIELPRDMVDALLPMQASKIEPKVSVSDSAALSEALQEVKNLLSTCKRPVIWLGHETQRYNLSFAISAFANRYQIPIVTSLLAKTVVSEFDPMFAGIYQGSMSRPEVVELMNACDCVLMLGLLLTDIDTGIFTAKLNHEMRIAANVNTIEIGQHQYPKIAFTEFVIALTNTSLQNTFSHPFKASNDRNIPPFIPHPTTKITTGRVFECIQHHLKREHIIVADIGDSLFGSADLILEKDSYLACAYYAGLGFATPGCIGAQLAAPTRRVIGIIGDGAFQMTAMELSTAVRYQLDPIIIILNNQGYGTERPLLEGAYNDIQNWNYAAIPQVLRGGIGITVKTEEELEAALTSALACRGTFHLIEIALEKTDFSPALRRFEQLVAQNSTKA